MAGMIKALGGLEDDLDDLDTKVADMKRQMLVKTQKEIDALYGKVREAANAEAEATIAKAREEADAEAARISKEADSRLEDVRAGIDAGHDDAVGIVVDTVTKP